MNAAGMMVALQRGHCRPENAILSISGNQRQHQPRRLDGKRHNLSGIIATSKKTAAEKIESMVAHHNDDLTGHLNKFNAVGQQGVAAGFREAQIMIGYVTTIMAKSGLRN